MKITPITNPGSKGLLLCSVRGSKDRKMYSIDKHFDPNNIRLVQICTTDKETKELTKVANLAGSGCFHLSIRPGEALFYCDMDDLSKYTDHLICFMDDKYNVALAASYATGTGEPS